MLQTCEWRMERRILHVVRATVTSAEITARTITKDIVAVAQSFKWKWGEEAMWLEWTSADGQGLG